MEVVAVRRRVEEPDEYERLEEYEGLADLFAVTEEEDEAEEDGEEEDGEEEAAAGDEEEE